MYHQYIYIYNIYVFMMADFYFDRNIFDWICYIFLLVCISTHLADIIQHTTTIARAHIRLMAVTIILLWLRLMKVVRCFTLLGKLVFLLPFFRIIQCHIFVHSQTGTWISNICHSTHDESSVLQPKTNTTLFGPVNFSVFI